MHSFPPTPTPTHSTLPLPLPLPPPPLPPSSTRSDLIVGFNPEDYMVEEGEIASVIVVLSQSFSEVVTVQINSQDGSASGTIIVCLITG